MSQIPISIVIPCYNDFECLERLLYSLVTSDYSCDDIIVFDDASPDTRIKSLCAKYPVRYFKNEKNRGVGQVRNAAASYAKHDILLFIDSDIIVRQDTVKKLSQHFRYEETVCVMGVCDKTPANKGITPSFIALEWNYFNCLSTNMTNELHTFCMAIRKKQFFAEGGFREDLLHIEEWELGYRLSRKYSLLVDHEVIVQHHFDTLAKRFITLMTRVRRWTALVHHYRAMAGKYATVSEGAARLSGVLLIVSLPLCAVHPVLIVIVVISMVTHISLSRKFYSFVKQEKGYTFVAIAVLLKNIFGCALLLGVMLGSIDVLTRRDYFSRSQRY